MSNNINQENRKKPFNGNKKFNKKPREPKVNPHEVKASLGILKEVNENVYTEILDVLASTKFNKVSIPLGIYKSLIDSNVDADDSRITTIGYIRDYDAETKEFTVIIFKGFIDYIKKNDCSVMDLLFTETRNGTLGTITKFVIRSCYDYCTPADNEEDLKPDC